MKLIVEGSEPLVGGVRVSGAKNSALKIIVASLFSNEEVILTNVPKIENVLTDLEVIKELGASVEWSNDGRLIINASGMNSYEIPFELGSKYRTVALLAGPLLYRFGRANIPKPGGCKIGFRPLNRWVETWETLGFTIKEDDKFYYVESGKLASTEISFKINTVMGTENAILCSLFINGETTINNAAYEPEVDDLIKFLVEIGVNIKRVSERKILINGTSSFKGAKYRIMPDRNEVVTFATAALLTFGDIKIFESIAEDLLPFTRKMEQMGANFEFDGDTLRVWRLRGQALKAINVETAPAPGFMTDWQPLITLLATQLEGVSTIHDTVYADRFGYTKELNRMGAKITLMKPSQMGMETVISDDMYDIKKLGEPLTVAKVEGPTTLRREKLNIPDLRAGAALVLAALMADGRSEVHGIENVDRGYEAFEEKLTSLGAKITKTD